MMYRDDSIQDLCLLAGQSHISSSECRRVRKWRDHKGRSLLHFACARNQVHLVERLIALGVNVNAVDRLQTTPLICACENRASLKLVSALLRAGAAVSKCDSIGRSALYVGTYHLRQETLRLLITMGASLDSETKNYETPLTAAIVRRRRSIVKLYCESGADVNYICGDGGNALYYALYERWEWGGRYLIRRGAKLCGVRCRGRSLIEWAAMSESPTLVRMIWKRLHGSEDGIAEIREAFRRRTAEWPQHIAHILRR